MSMEMIAQVLKMSNARLSRAEHRMLMVLAYHTNRETGFAYPGHRLLAKELLITTRQVIKLIQRLEKAGWIEVRRGQGRGHLSVYRLKVAPEVIHRKGELLPDRAPRKGELLDHEKVNFCATPYKEVEPKERKGRASAREDFSLSRDDRLAIARRVGMTPGSVGWHTYVEEA